MKLTRIAVLVAASAAAVFAQLPTMKILTVDVAQSIAQEAMMTCRGNGYHVTVQVVDSGNFLKAFLRDDGAGFFRVLIDERIKRLFEKCNRHACHSRYVNVRVQRGFLI